MHKWISVTDRLPENTDDVLGWDLANSECVICYWMANIKEWHQFFSDDKLFITHWVPLPSKPE